MSQKRLEIFIDGASKGNPGPSGVGVVITETGGATKTISRFIGNATNNIAEYSALICALEHAASEKADSILISTDSELLYRQIKKIYRVKNPHIAQLYMKAQLLMASFREAAIRHIPREENKRADKLATAAVREGLIQNSVPRQAESGRSPE